MGETSEKFLHNALRAEELLRHKGIRNCVLEELEISNQILPKKEKKQFEPNNSWLQNIQIEKGLKTYKDLLNIERVDRVSELANAEWIPAQKKALVTKRSGQDWNTFGLEKNGSLYLIPEEALFLLETNCLELFWNGVPCSIQQAYEILIDDSVCTLDEYRVYSQLTRYGYRIQRYIYEESEKCNRLDESISIKRKVIVEPENGLRMSDNQTQNQQTTEKTQKTLAKDTLKTLDKTIINYNIKDCQSVVEKPMEQIVSDVVDQLLHSVENQKSVNSSADLAIIEDNTKQKNSMNNEERKRASKLEIISDETLLGSIKILSDATCSSNKEVTTSKWPGARIQRNVKLLPRRSDKAPVTEISVIDSDCAGGSSQCTEKRKMLAQVNDSPDAKKPKHEIIELSDDEIQELPHPMTRMEMLNLLPNIASQSNISEKITKRYIPHSIRPQRDDYRYDRKKISCMQENDRKARQNCKVAKTNMRQNAYHCNAIAHRHNAIAVDTRNTTFQNAPPSLCTPPRPYYPLDPLHGTNISFSYAYNRVPFHYGQAAYQNKFCLLQNRITLMQQNVFHNMVVAYKNLRNAVQHHHSRSLTIQMNNYAMPFMGGMRHPLIENRHAFYQNFSWQQRFYQRRATENTAPIMHGNAYPVVRRRYDEASRSNNQNSYEVVNRPSFTTRSGGSSWSELKKKWCEEKTITIDDEDYRSKSENREECNEVQVVEQFINPLVGPRNASSLAEIFSKLAIIKSAPEKIVRRKKSKYKISYNVYSCAHRYRKTNPGQPLYSLVVTRKENAFLQPVELNRLQQDAKGSQIVLACVSMSISYVQAGVITMPNLV